MSGRRLSLSASGRSRDSESDGRLFGRRAEVAIPRRRARLSTRLVGRRAEVAIPRRRARQSTLRTSQLATVLRGAGSGTAGECRGRVARVISRETGGRPWCEAVDAADEPVGDRAARGESEGGAGSDTAGECRGGVARVVSRETGGRPWCESSSSCERLRGRASLERVCGREALRRGPLALLKASTRAKMGGVEG